MNGEPTLLFRDSTFNESLLPAPVPWAWIIAACLCIAILSAILLISRLRRKPTALPDRHAAYRQALADIEQASTLDAREAATRASLAIRHYLCAVARDRSLFETHEEFLARHPSLTHWPPVTVQSLVTTLKHLAEIKYRPLEEIRDPATLLAESRELLQTLDKGTAA